MFKTELHCHTSELSGCASESAVDTVRRYAELGYSSIVFTNHFSSWSFPDTGLATYEEYIQRHYEIVAETAEKTGTGLHLIPGLELAINDFRGDFLVFGPYYEVLRKMPNLFNERLHTIHDVLKEAGCVLIQAHPLRWGMQVANRDHIDGYEVMNTHPGHDSHNDVAMLLAKSVGGEGKILTSGSDHHDAWHVPTGGILTEKPICDAVGLVDVLKSGKYHIIGTR